jgi:hypothetical protein
MQQFGVIPSPGSVADHHDQSQSIAKFYRNGTPIPNPGKEISMKIL